jgi:hypothetical protein
MGADVMGNTLAYDLTNNMADINVLSNDTRY